VTHIGDFNGDGKSDFIWHHSDGSTAMWLLDGVNLLNGAVLMGSGSPWSVRVIGDYNGDGRSDLIWLNTDTSVKLWNMNGVSVLQEVLLISRAQIGAPADFSPVP